MIEFSQAIRWTDRNGTETEVRGGYFTTREAARKDAIDAATKLGWTPPKWWQWWRWNDTRISA